MTEQLQRLTDRFGANTAALAARYFENRTVFLRLGAFLLTASGREIPPAELEEGSVLAGRLSQDSEVQPLLCAWLLLLPEQAVRRVSRARRALERVFPPSSHLLTAACLMAQECSDTTGYDQIAGDTRRMHDEMRQADPYRTGLEDIPLCTLYVLRGQTDAVERMSTAVETLRPVLRLRNSVQALGQVLAAGDDVVAASRQALELNRELLGCGLHLGRGKSLSALGVLAGMNVPGAETAQTVAQVAQHLRRNPQLSGWSVGGKERLLWACYLTALAENRSAPKPWGERVLSAGLLAVAGACLPDPVEPSTLDEMELSWH